MKPVGKSHTFRLTLSTEYYLKWDTICGSLSGSQKLISIIDMLEREGKIPGLAGIQDPIQTAEAPNIFNGGEK